MNYEGTLSGELSNGTAVLTLKNLPASVLTGSDSNQALAVTCSIKMDTVLLGDITTSARMSVWVERLGRERKQHKKAPRSSQQNCGALALFQVVLTRR